MPPRSGVLSSATRSGSDAVTSTSAGASSLSHTINRSPNTINTDGQPSVKRNRIRPSSRASSGRRRAPCSTITRIAGAMEPSATAPRFTVMECVVMDFDLSPDHELIRRTVRDFAEQEVAPVAEHLDKTKSFPYEIVRKLGDLGFMGIPFPEEYGGAGADSLAYAIAVEELTRVDSSVAITMCAHTSLGTQPVYLFGSAAQKERYLPDLLAGRKLGAFGLTEPEA